MKNEITKWAFYHRGEAGRVPPTETLVLYHGFFCYFFGKYIPTENRYAMTFRFSDGNWFIAVATAAALLYITPPFTVLSSSPP